ncbi:MAG: pyridoxal-phosphate dependent enzyme [Sulfitobacter sp.]|nr:pyridoxal-phosphate dependent enzyme [Sulfitobacter sp.]
MSTTIGTALTRALFPGGDLPTCNSVLDAIGNSPMVALERFGNGIAPSLFAKLEASNPGGSMKDRAALGMLEWAEREYDLRPGAEIVICTSGNMGVGMAVVCAVKGFRLVCLVDPKINPATEQCLRIYGAEVIKVYQRDHTSGYHLTRLRRVETLLEERPGAIYLDQYNSPAAVAVYEETLAPEILTDLEGRVEALVLIAGTGGSSMGVARYFSTHSPSTDIWLVDEYGSLALPGNPGVEDRYLNGMGTGIEPANYANSGFDELIHHVVYVHAAEAIAASVELARSEGILTGGSGGAALHVMRDVVAPGYAVGANIVTLLPDHGSRYTETQFNREWLAARDIYVPSIFEDE